MLEEMFSSCLLTTPPNILYSHAGPYLFTCVGRTGNRTQPFVSLVLPSSPTKSWQKKDGMDLVTGE